MCVEGVDAALASEGVRLLEGTVWAQGTERTHAQFQLAEGLSCRLEGIQRTP